MTDEKALKVLNSIEILSFRDKKQKYFMKDVCEAQRVAIKALENMPKKGRWIWKSGKTIDYCSCSVCKKGQWEIEWNYCPNCGAKMRGDKNDE